MKTKAKFPSQKGNQPNPNWKGPKERKREIPMWSNRNQGKTSERNPKMVKRRLFKLAFYESSGDKPWTLKVTINENKSGF